MNLANYRKLIVAAVALALIVGRQFFGLNVDDANADKIIDMALALAALVGVHQAPNAPQ